MTCRATVNACLSKGRTSENLVQNNLVRAVRQNRLENAQSPLKQLVLIAIQKAGHSRLISDFDYLTGQSHEFAANRVTQEDLNILARLRSAAQYDTTGNITKALKAFPGTPSLQIPIPRDIQLLFRPQIGLTQEEVALSLGGLSGQLQLPLETLESIAGVRAPRLEGFPTVEPTF
jgi:hypothetical protein